MICSRILFLLTYGTHFNFDNLFDEHSLAKSITQVGSEGLVCFSDPHAEQNLAFHAAKYRGQNLHKDEKDGSKPIYSLRATDSRALSESLKLLFNLSQFYPNRIDSFGPALPHILTILYNTYLEPQPLQPPVTFLINALLNLDLLGASDAASDTSRSSTSLFPSLDSTIHTERLVDLLDRSIQAYDEESLEKLAIPLLTLIRRIYEIAPPDVQEHMRGRLLPSDAERDKPLGSSDSLASRMLRLSNIPIAPQVREGVSNLLFELSGKNPGSFVRNVGYGYAAGYLISHKIAIPKFLKGEDLGAKVTSVDGEDINPITGQRRAMEPPDPGLNMTDEEKEREAERLFVLFERLKATGVVDVTNPVEKAVREGSFEEVANE